MSTPVSTSALLRRIAARAGLGLWNNRGTVVVAAVVSLALGGYLVFAGATIPALAGSSAASSASTDCADTAIAAIANRTPAAAQRAYQCMDASFQQRVPEQTFVQQIQSQSVANANSVERVGDYRTPAGGQMVYYAVNANGQSAGYIVYLGQNGKVLRIE